MTIPALLLIDRIGRRPALVGGAISLMIWWFTTAGILATHGHPAPPGGLNHVAAESWVISGPASKAVIAASYLIVASFAPTWGPVSWTYPPELFPLRLRAKGVSLSTAACWAMNFALGYFTPPAFTNIAWKTYLGTCFLINPIFSAYRSQADLCHSLWSVLCRNGRSRIPMFPRNRWQAAGGNRRDFRTQGSGLEDKGRLCRWSADGER